MSWLISQALMQDFENSRCSQEPVAEYSEATCSDGGQSAQSSTQPTPQAYCSPDRMTEFSRLSRFGMTFAHFPESHGEELLMWYLAGFHAKTYQAQGKALESKAPGLGYGEKWHELSVKFDLDLCSWKTVHCLFPEDLPWSSVTLPRSGMMRDGCVYQQESVARITKGTDCGSLEKFPTPTVKGNYNRKGLSKTSGDGLATYVKKYPFPTPCASDNRNRGSTQTPAIARRIEKGKQVMLSMTLDGPMNPVFVEWLMGWPIGWTDLKPLETAKFHEWRQQHSASYQIAEKERKDDAR